MKYWMIILNVLLVGCGAESLPQDFAPGEGCLLATETPLEPTHDDPHEGTKNVYYCGVEETQLVSEQGIPQLPYPEGTRILKVSTKEGQGYPWLVAEMEKVGGEWAWAEFTRNFPDEDFVKIPVGEDTCTGCHVDARDSDWVFTLYTGQ
jgi:hypothetical protein